MYECVLSLLLSAAASSKNKAAGSPEGQERPQGGKEKGKASRVEEEEEGKGDGGR